MNKFLVDNNGFIALTITDFMEEKAKEIRRIRDDKYGNIYQEEESDERWVGDLGEICINKWIKSFNLTPKEDFSWILENVSGKPDFIIGEISIDIKTVKRKVPPKPDYTAQITARHSNEKCNYYFFCCYEISKKKMWLLGGIQKNKFLEKAKYYSGGEWVHSNYQIREGHEIYNIEINELLSCDGFSKEIGLI